jgi:hypothetical protein
MTRSIVMSKQFADETAKMDGTLKQKVLTFMGKFQRGVDGGLDLKQPKSARSSAVFTARVNDNYRAVLADVGGDAWALISVRPHDDAYTFAGTLRVEVNPRTGGFDIIDETALAKARALAAGTTRVAEVSGARVGALSSGIDEGGSVAGSDGSSADSGRRESVGRGEATVPAEPELVALDEGELLSVGLDPETAHSLAGSVERSQAEAVAENLPTAQGAALLDVLAGRPIAEIQADYMAPEPVDTGDVQTALKRPVSQMTFVDMEDAQAVQAAMSGSLEAWRVWLHPAQRALADHGPWKGSFRVTGGAGTGKTVTAVHRAVHLARQPGLVRVPGARFAPVVFVTYTRNLATAIESQVRAVIRSGDVTGDEAAKKEQDRVAHNIEVLSTDALARRIADLDPALAEEVGKGRPATSTELGRACADAVIGTSVEPGFLAEEWEQVVLGGGVTTRDEYLAVARSGRGRRLSRAQRVQVWTCVDRLTTELSVMNRYTWEQLRDLVARALEADEREDSSRAVPGSGLRARTGVRHLVVDEAQDLTASHWRMLRALVPAGPDDLFIAGDAHQRIYGRPVPLSRFGIETRGRSRRLTVNYRTSREILRWSLGVADAGADDLDDEVDPLTGERSVFSGPAVDVVGQGALAGIGDDPDRAMVQWIRALFDEVDDEGARKYWPRDIAVVRMDNRGVVDTVGVLTDAGIDAVEVKGGTDEDRLDDAVRVMTMHRAKGLEYKAVVIRDGDLMPSEAQAAVDVESRKLRNLFYVAGTRARERLLMTGISEGMRKE